MSIWKQNINYCELVSLLTTPKHHGCLTDSGEVILQGIAEGGKENKKYSFVSSVWSGGWEPAYKDIAMTEYTKVIPL